MAINTLNIGDMILVHGFIMLKGLNHGKHYKVISMDDYSYTFRLHNGKTLCRHYINSVEGSIKCHISGDNNGIEVCTKIRKAKPSIKQDLKDRKDLQEANYRAARHQQLFFNEVRRTDLA